MKIENKLIKNCQYFYTASEKAKSLFMYPIYVGVTDKEDGFYTERNNFDSFLIMILTEGEAYVYHENKKLTVKAGEAVIMDCYKHHRYGAKSKCKMFWLHFDGVMARKYYEYISSESPIIRLQEKSESLNCIEDIYNIFRFRSKINESKISLKIMTLLTDLINDSTNNDTFSCQRDAIESTLDYITRNMSKPITLNEMAENVNLSPYYFSRLFKENTGYTPHEYLINTRINKAKFLLKSTEHTIKEIAFYCGFTNECLFSSSFKKNCGITPLAYRRQN